MLLVTIVAMVTYLICYSDVTNNHGNHSNIPEMFTEMLLVTIVTTGTHGNIPLPGNLPIPDSVFPFKWSQKLLSNTITDLRYLTIVYVSML